jgi:hypothetical protein
VTVPETILTFVGAPAAIVLAIVLIIVGPSQLKAPAERARYRPGRPWTHPAAWFLPRPEAIKAESLPSASRAELNAARAAVSPTADNSVAVGGATGEW